MRLLDYQRFVVAYHGCDKEIADQVLSGERDLQFSANPHDWLGKGIYFWEYGPHRAYEWAQLRSSGVGGPGVKITKAAVVGALIHLGNCFDLLDTANTSLLEAMFSEFKKDCETKGLTIPVNSRAHRQDIDHTKRLLDCAMVNYAVEAVERTEASDFILCEVCFRKDARHLKVHSSLQSRIFKSRFATNQRFLGISSRTLTSSRFDDCVAA